MYSMVLVRPLGWVNFRFELSSATQVLPKGAVKSSNLVLAGALFFCMSV